MSSNVVDLKEKVNSSFFPKHQEAIYRRLQNKDLAVELNEEDPLGTEMVLNLGPVHPATHGAHAGIEQLSVVDESLVA